MCRKKCIEGVEEKFGGAEKNYHYLSQKFIFIEFIKNMLAGHLKF